MAQRKTDEIPRALCPECHVKLRPYEVLLDLCPKCDAVLEQVLVDPKTAREIEGR
ncbi:MAG TPA: hypothetical protein VEY12_05250 [Thermoplasmata archaeon]|nr:hypothetical protein [Thermoplasmata archaeon]